jgi:hypothetical protein
MNEVPRMSDNLSEQPSTQTSRYDLPDNLPTIRTRQSFIQNIERARQERNRLQLEHIHEVVRQIAEAIDGITEVPDDLIIARVPYGDVPRIVFTEQDAEERNAIEQIRDLLRGSGWNAYFETVHSHENNRDDVDVAIY